MVDHRAAQSPVRDQGDRPTCVAFAVSAAHEWIEGGNDARSAEDALWAAHQEGGPPTREDTAVRLALAGLERLGHAEESAWPYGNPAWPASCPPAAQLPGRRRALPVWREIAAGWQPIVDEVEAGNPVIVTLRLVAPAWVQAEIDAAHNSKAPTNHAVLAVGTRDGEDVISQALVVKNSWGSDWGDDGYGFVSTAYVEAFAIRAHVLEP